MWSIAQTEFDALAELVARRSGLLLTADKTELILRRLGPVARRFGFRNGSALLAELAHAPEEIAQAVTETMMTNETSFFRDERAFEHFRSNVLPHLFEARAGTKRLRVWSAGTATGQEAYSLAMLLDEARLARAGWRLDIVATDFSADAIARARSGLYSRFEVERGLSGRSLAQYFSRDGEQWRVNERLRQMVTFRVFNLLDDFGWLREFDVIFCRNVLMYLDHRARANVLRKFSQTLAADGTLVLGALETNLETGFAPAAGPRGFFAKSRSAARAASAAV